LNASKLVKNPFFSFQFLDKGWPKSHEERAKKIPHSKIVGFQKTGGQVTAEVQKEHYHHSSNATPLVTWVGGCNLACFDPIK
jgi:hypothetical protein